MQHLSKELQSSNKLRNIDVYKRQMLLDFNNHELAVRIIGMFNAYYLLAVFGTAVVLGK